MNVLAILGKRAFWAMLACLMLVLFPLPSYALTVRDVPNPRQEYGGWVTDMAQIISPDTEAKLNQIISELEHQNGSEIAVVTVRETAPASTPKAFATALFNHWGIGKKGKDNGVLFLVSKDDRRVEIETGYGVQAILPDIEVGTIIDSQIIPQFKRGNFDRGILAGTEKLVGILVSSQLSAATSDSGTTGFAQHQDAIDLENITGRGNDAWRWSAIALSIITILFFVFLSSFLPQSSASSSQKKKYNVFLEPKGQSRSERMSSLPHTICCAQCKQPMEEVDASQVESYLSQPERVAFSLGSVKFEGWRCPQCAENLEKPDCHIRAIVNHSYQFQWCSTCQEFTVERKNKTLKAATYKSEGKRRITDRCHCCSYHQETEESIPRLKRYSSSSSSRRISSGSSSYDYGGSSSSSSFGGGDSGGGGAGGSW